MLTAITGAAGHVGQNLVRELVSRQRQVRAVDLDPRTLAGQPVEIVTADVTDLNSLVTALAGVEVVYHLAAHIRIGDAERQRMEDVNVGGTTNVVEACRRCGVRRLIHFSSIHAYSYLPADQPIDEERALLEDGSGFAYDRTKAAGERVVRAAIEQGLDAVIINPTAILGPHDFRPSPMGRVIAQLARGELRFLVSGGYDWVDVRDVVAGAIAAAEHGRAGGRYLLSGQWCSVQQLADTVQELTAVRIRRFTIPASLATWVFRGYAQAVRLWGGQTMYLPETVQILQRHRHVSCGKAQRELGYRPRPLRQTLADTLAELHRRSSLP